MKKLLLLVFLFTFIGCKKKSSAPATTTAPTTNSQTNVLTALESSLIGDWALDSVVYYAQGIRVGSDAYNDPINCHLKLISDVSTIYGPTKKTGYSGVYNCTETEVGWKETNNKLDISGQLYEILSLDAQSLTYLYGSKAIASGSSGYTYHLHK